MAWTTAVLLVTCAILTAKGAAGQEVNTTDFSTVPTELTSDPDRTTILFSGFFLPSTVPPSIPTTRLTTDVQTVFQEEVLTVQQPIQDTTIPQSVRPQENVNVTNETRAPPKPLRVIEVLRPSVEESLPTNVPIKPVARVLKAAVTTPSQRTDKIIDEIKAQNSPLFPASEQIIDPRNKQDPNIAVNLVSGDERALPKLPLFELENESREEQPYDLERKRLIDEHPCRRDCKGSKLMTCRYNFKVEWFESMSKACFNCPSNVTDCMREHCLPTDGIQRPLTVVNRKFPGPTIEVCLGDNVEILLENRLMSETTTVHWHGLHQKESPYMDGVPFISQCPVGPRSDFLYRYTAANVGTHFWHSHSGVQRADGMFGALVIRSGSEVTPAPYDLDLTEHLIQVVDWGHEPTISVFTGHHHAKTDNKPPTLLVNGRGVFAGAPPASFTVVKGMRYRFRLINAGVLNCPVELTIDNHTMVVIGSDGSLVEPIEADSLVSYAGERWDFVLKANAPIGNYWMRFRGLMDCDQRFTSANTVAVLHYATSPNQLPSGPIGYTIGYRKGIQVNPLNERTSEPTTFNANELQAHRIPADKSLKPIPDRRVILSYDFNPIDNEHLYKKGVYGFYEVADRRERVLTPQFNHVALALPPFPLLSQYSELRSEMMCSRQNLAGCSKKYCECLNLVELNLGEVVELMFIDIGDSYDANHPFHLHGHAFRVVAMDRLGNATTVSDVLELEARGSIKRNLVDPPLKDTVTVPDGGYTIVRFVADNPGYWMLHCHLEFHVELGMAIVFKVGETSDFPPVPPGFPKCGSYYTPPLAGGENEIYWTYNATNTQGTSFTLTDWWPLKGNKNSSPKTSSSLFLSAALLWLLGTILH